MGTVEFLYFLPLSGSRGPWVLQSSEHVCTQMFQKHQTAEEEEQKEEEAEEEEDEEGIKERRREMGGG